MTFYRVHRPTVRLSPRLPYPCRPVCMAYTARRVYRYPIKFLWVQA